MATIVERTQGREVISEWLGDIDRISLAMQRGSMDALYELEVKLIGEEEEGVPEFRISNVAGNLDERTLATLVCAETLLRDLRYNFGWDCTGFPPEGITASHEIAQYLGSFIQEGAFGSRKEMTNPLLTFGMALKSFYKLIDITDEAARKTGDASSWYHF